MNIVMEEGSNTAYMVSGYEFNEEELSSLLQEPVFNKYNAIAKNGLAAALKEYYAAATNAEKVLILKRICRMNGWDAKNKRQVFPSPNKHTAVAACFPQFNELLHKSFRGNAPFVNTSTMQMYE